MHGKLRNQSYRVQTAPMVTVRTLHRVSLILRSASLAASQAGLPYPAHVFVGCALDGGLHTWTTGSGLVIIRELCLCIENGDKFGYS